MEPYAKILEGMTIDEKVRLYEPLQCLWRSQQDAMQGMVRA